MLTAIRLESTKICPNLWRFHLWKFLDREGSGFGQLIRNRKVAGLVRQTRFLQSFASTTSLCVSLMAGCSDVKVAVTFSLHLLRSALSDISRGTCSN